MKYGIQSIDKDGNVKYACSTRFRGSYVTDITDIALFVQEKSAVTALKELRRAGDEADGQQLSVVEINFVVNKVIEVQRPKAKQGYMLVKPKPNNPDYSYFFGTKTAKGREGNWGDYSMFANKERATAFATEDQAIARRDALVATAQSYKEFNEKSGTRHQRYDETWEQCEQRFKDDIARYQGHVDEMQSLKIIPV